MPSVAGHPLTLLVKYGIAILEMKGPDAQSKQKNRGTNEPESDAPSAAGFAAAIAEKPPRNPLTVTRSTIWLCWQIPGVSLVWQFQAGFDFLVWTW